MVRVLPPPAPGTTAVDLLPGAVLFGVGVQALHVFTVVYVARAVTSKSQSYGVLGTSLALLLWAYLMGRLVVAAAALNVSWWRRREERAA